MHRDIRDISRIQTSVSFAPNLQVCAGDGDIVCGDVAHIQHPDHLSLATEEGGLSPVYGKRSVCV